MIGVYVQMNYQASGKQVAPMERAMRLSDEVIRYLTANSSLNCITV
ncbi:30S ribosomal protein S6 [Microcystis aeruginosa KW]|uniref:Small ribosomal subunit protein bS6 n=1 Tax=Microcystis aeruginosa KW TaxID=1960155 RepID=A0A1V4BVQ9_MICAE|nr:30S ribosomal protein S6 [Microcystis aeruginosa KW]